MIYNFYLGNRFFRQLDFEIDKNDSITWVSFDICRESVKSEEKKITILPRSLELNPLE